jgi:hypothetical protein
MRRPIVEHGLRIIVPVHSRVCDGAEGPLTGIGLQQLRMERRMKSAVTVQIAGVTWLA